MEAKDREVIFLKELILNYQENVNATQRGRKRKCFYLFHFTFPSTKYYFPQESGEWLASNEIDINFQTLITLLFEL